MGLGCWLTVRCGKGVMGGGGVCWDSRLDFPSKLLRLLIHAGQEDIQTVFGQNDLEQVAARAAEKNLKPEC